MNATDIRIFSTQLQETMKSKLEAIAQENKEIMARASKSLTVIRSAIGELKQFVYQHAFQSKAQEIEFFKEIKPVIASQYFYYETLFNLKIHEPAGETTDMSQFYRDELNSLNSYIAKHKEFYAYCLSGSTDLDELYFISRPGIFLSPDLDTKFSTGYDTVLATILANLLLKEYIEGEMQSRANTTSPLTWTTKKTHLIELIYALHAVKAFNNGAAEIKQIAAMFEKQFSINLGSFYRHFSEIAIRKSGQTNFLDQMKATLEKRIDEML